MTEVTIESDSHDLESVNEDDFDSIIDDKEMANLLSGAGNHASKLVLLAAMKQGEVYG